MDPTVWLENAHAELLDLVGQESLDPLDAWRFCALLARLEGSAEGRRVSDEMRGRLSQIAATLAEPDGQRFVETLADGLDDESDDAWGPLLDALLDVDDAVGALQVLHRRDEAIELAARAAGLVSLSPERVMPLGPFAEMRLATLERGSVIERMWQAVEAAPALALAEALPPPGEMNDDVREVASANPWLAASLAGWPTDLESEAGAAAHIQIGPPEHEFTATLGSVTERTTLSWGEIRTISVPIGTTVELVFLTGQVWYRVATHSALLPEKRWVLERGEAPVLLVATDSTQDETLEGALARGARAAGLLLKEA